MFLVNLSGQSTSAARTKYTAFLSVKSTSTSAEYVLRSSIWIATLNNSDPASWEDLHNAHTRFLKYP